MTADSDRRMDSSLCPSAPARDGAILLTVVGIDGEPAYIPDRLPVTAAFLAGVDPAALERRFRFASPCQHAACAHWSGNACSIPEKLVTLLAADASAPLPRCAIRRDCRWFAQAGPEACRRCPAVTRTDGA